MPFTSQKNKGCLNMVMIGFPIPRKRDERRRALIPFDLPCIPRVDQLVFETDYGAVLGYSDNDYRAKGANIGTREDVVACPIICNPKPVLTDEYFRHDKLLFGWIHSIQNRAITDLLIMNTMTAIAWEDMSESGRHLFCRNNEISGEAAVSHAFLHWGRVPFGTRVAVIGRGNVARGAIRILERYGCDVTVYDQHTSHSLSGEIGRYDVIVNAVLWQGQLLLSLVPVRTSSMYSSFQPQARRFMATLSLSGCCFSSDKVSRFSQAKFSRRCLLRMRDSSSRYVTSRHQ